MRLNRIEIAGFKSFPDRSELTFDAGVTAIVGPNGCGKSNVVDALTWVLGEQSAKSLRGDRMEDVIFGGSDARKPTAAAEVRLKLSGRGRASSRSARDGGGTRTAWQRSRAELMTATAVAVEEEPPLIVKDVELMRRLYRSGESEYLIDGENCRLRDVQDLLMDAGLGIKAYAVIEQGKIGQILERASHRPPATDRRSGRRHEVQEPPPAGRTEARSGAAEPDARRRHRLRGREAARRAEAAGREGAPLSAPSRRAAPLGEGAVRESLPRRSARRSSPHAHDSRTRASVRPRPQRALPRPRASLERLRLELTEADATTTAAREAAHASELAIGRLQQQIAFDKQQVETLGADGSRHRAGSAGARRAPRAGAARAPDAARCAGAMPRRSAIAAAGAMHAEESAYASTAAQHHGPRSGCRRPRAAKCSRRVNAATALRHAMDHAAAAATRLASRSPSSTARATTSGSKRNAPPRSGQPPKMG